MKNKYTQSARGQDCTLRFNECNGDPETTVFAHIWRPGHGRMGGKTKNKISGCFACAVCHDIQERRIYRDYEPDFIRLRAYEAMMETQDKMIDDGVLVL